MATIKVLLQELLLLLIDITNWMKPWIFHHSFVLIMGREKNKLGLMNIKHRITTIYRYNMTPKQLKKHKTTIIEKNSSVQRIELKKIKQETTSIPKRKNSSKALTFETIM